jgi:hypothetical protein
MFSSRESYLGVASGYGLGNLRAGVWCPVEARDIFYSAASRPAPGPTQLLVQWVPGVKRPCREVDPSTVSSAEVKNVWSYAFNSPYTFIAWCLIKYGYNFIIFYF